MDEVGVDVIRDKVAFEESDVKDGRSVRKVRGFVGRSDDKVGEFLIESLEFTRVKVLIGAPNQVILNTIANNIAIISAMMYCNKFDPRDPLIMVYHRES